MSYKKALEILKSIPPEEQVLAAGVYKFFDDTGKAVCGCAVGKILPSFYNDITPDISVNEEGIEDLLFYIEGVDEFLDEMESLGISEDELQELQKTNDTFKGYKYSLTPNRTPEDNSEMARKERYIHVIKWLEEQVANEDITVVS